MSFAKLASSVALIAFLAGTAKAHMEISEPVPFRSKFAGDSGNTDYSMTAPLNKDGSNYPCKGYQVDLGTTTSASQTITAGQDMTVKMAGSAVHNGGSCQFSLSYDKGATFGAIHSVVGNCPIDTSYTFQVPAGVPAGKDVLFAWTWFNHSGNREMYMNCAPVNVDSSGSGLTVPQMFVANVFGEGTCTTIEGQDIDFANPGSQVANCPADKLVTPDKTVTFGSGGAAPPAPPPTEPSSAPPVDPPTPTEPAPVPEPTDDCPEESPAPEPTDDCPEENTTTAAPAPPPSSAPAPPPSSAPAPTPSTPASPPPSTGGSCTGGQIQCGADGKTWSMCANGVFVNMGSVAAGTSCTNGAITRRSAFSRRHNA